MRKRSEIKTDAEAPKAEAPKAEKSEAAKAKASIEKTAPDEIRFASAMRKGKEHELREDMERIVEAVFVNDLHATWQKLQAALTVGEKRSDHGTLQAALDEAESNAQLAHRLYVTAKIERERWESENDVIFGAMWSEAAKDLHKEKESGARSKQITDADVKARVAVMHPDEYAHQESKRAKVKATVDTMANLSEVWMSRCRSLQAMLGKLRG